MIYESVRLRNIICINKMFDIGQCCIVSCKYYVILLYVILQALYINYFASHFFSIQCLVECVFSVSAWTGRFFNENLCKNQSPGK